MNFVLLPRELLGLSASLVVATVRSDEHGDSRPAIGFDFVVVLCSRLIEACDNQEIGSLISAANKRADRRGSGTFRAAFACN